MATTNPAPHPKPAEAPSRFAQINPVHAVPLAQAFESACNWDELYACLRLIRKQSGTAVDLFGYLQGYHFEDVEIDNETEFARVTAEAGEWLDARATKSSPMHVRFS